MTGIAAGVIATFAYPSWIAFDYLVEPDSADEILALRLLITLPVAICTLLLIFSRIGRARPELLMFGISFSINVGIALMLVAVETHYAAYALGMSLTMYAAAFLLIWSPIYTVALGGFSLAFLTLALVLSDPVSTDAVATVYFYFGTGCLLSFLGQAYRERSAWSEFEVRDALEREQERSSALLRELDKHSHEDALTGLSNRRAWDSALDRECARAGRDGKAFSILLCDLDQLKLINDQLGHPVGDTVLKSVGRLLREHARESDVIARIGGDEFAVLSPGADLLEGTELAERLRATIETETTAASGLGGVTVSVGVADWEGGDDSAETLMLRADRRLYRAKVNRNVVCAGDPPGFA
jgi:diguanylate cyclase (GGDEF)-like protein